MECDPLSKSILLSRWTYQLLPAFPPTATLFQDAMDYRSTIVDDEHPAGASPWGSSSPAASPRHNESTFSSIGNEPPPSLPYQYTANDSSNGFAHDDPGVNAFRRPDTASSTASTSAYDPSEQSAPSEGQQEQPTEADAKQPQPQPQPSTPPKSQPQVRSRGPQYKLQAKITGLERTGRKDPILRFDVHVGFDVRSLCAL